MSLNPRCWEDCGINRDVGEARGPVNRHKDDVRCVAQPERISGHVDRSQWTVAAGIHQPTVYIKLHVGAAACGNDVIPSIDWKRAGNEFATAINTEIEHKPCVLSKVSSATLSKREIAGRGVHAAVVDHHLRPGPGVVGPCLPGEIIEGREAVSAASAGDTGAWSSLSVGDWIGEDRASNADHMTISSRNQRACMSVCRVEAGRVRKRGWQYQLLQLPISRGVVTQNCRVITHAIPYFVFR